MHKFPLNFLAGDCLQYFFSCKILNTFAGCLTRLILIFTEIMKALFEILPGDFDSKSCTLSAEVSGRSFSYAVKNQENVIISAGVYHFDKNHPDPGNPIALQILFHHHPVLSQQFGGVCVVYSLSESVLIPAVLYNSRKNAEVLKLVHGDVKSGLSIFTEKIHGLDLYNIYRVNSSIYDTLNEKFKPALHIHQYSLFLKRLNGTATNCLKVIFYSYKMVVYLYQDGVCRLMNAFTYKAPEDVSYVLLNIRSQFEAFDVPVEISGMIEENSALFKEIYRYFETVKLTDSYEAFELADEFSKYPTHFFTHIFAFDQCAL